MADSLLSQGIQAARDGQRQEARALLVQAVRADPSNAQAWLWLSAVVEGDEQKRYCLQRVLAIDPRHPAALQGLALLAGPAPVSAGEGQGPTAAPVRPAAAGEEESIAAPAPPSLAPTRLAAPPPEPSLPQLELVPTPVPPPQEPAGTPPEPPPAPSQRRLQLLLLILIGVALLALVAVVVLPRLRPAPAPAVAQASPPAAAGSSPETESLASTATARPPTATPTRSPAPTPSPQPVARETSCPIQPPEGILVDCFKVAVPEDRAGDPADTIHLAVALLHGRGDSISPYPIVFLQGGPGSGALDFADRQYTDYSNWVDPLLDGHDLIVLDQRGTGYSDPPMQCNELISAYGRDIREGWDAEQREEGYRSALLACRDRLTRAGVKLSAYTTAANAADVVDVLDALGYEQADLYGVSYGTRLGQAVMRDFPERVHSAVLDSPVPLQDGLFPRQEELEDAALQALFQGCAADAECRAAFPALEETYRELAAQMEAAPAPVPVPNMLADGGLYTVTVDADWLRSAVAWGLRSPELLEFVPGAIQEARAGDYTGLAYFLYAQAAGCTTLNLGMTISVECSEEILPLSPEELAAVSGQRNETSAFLSGADDPELIADACREWGALPAGEGERRGPVGDIPVLVLAGQYDPVTPPLLGDEIVQTLAHGLLLEVPGMGHVPSMWPAGDCPRAIILDFFADPTRPPDDSCLAGLAPAPFQLFTAAQDVRLEPFEDPVMRVRGVRPAGWQPDTQGLGNLNRMAELFDPTQTTIQGADVTVEYWVGFLKDNFAGVGLAELPQPAGRRQANGLTWNLYTAETGGNPVDIALARGNRQAILVLMVSKPEEHEEMYEKVFIPMVDAAVEW